jgi:hypothetical protein
MSSAPTSPDGRNVTRARLYNRGAVHRKHYPSTDMN